MDRQDNSIEPTATAAPPLDASAGLGRVVRRVALLNLGYFGVEFTVALAIGSVSLFADSVDFLEDACNWGRSPGKDEPPSNLYH